MSRQVIFLILFFVVAGSWGLSIASKRLERVAEGVIPLDARSFETLTVVAVGTGGTHENHQRLGPCIAVGLEDTVVLVDAGRGLGPALRSATLPVAQPRTLMLTTLLPENTVGVADWLIFMFLIKPKLEQTERTGAWQGRGRWTSLAAFKGAFLLFCFVVLPTVGYVIGRLFGPIFVGSGG